MSQFILCAMWRNELQDYITVGHLLYDPSFAKNHGMVGFMYDTDYIKAGHGSLDPKHIHTLLDGGNYTVNCGGGVLPHYFQQFLPGEFAEQLLFQYDENWSSITQFEKLFVLSNIYGDFHALQINPQLEKHPTDINDISDLDRLVVKFRAFQKDFSDTPLDQKLIGSFSSFQGKRMKFDYYDKDDRKRYIVKLNNTQYCNDAKVSSFLSDVQANAGINTTSSSVRTIGSGEDVLFQENFANNKVVTDNGVKLTMYNRVNFKVLVSDLDSPALSKNITYTTVADAIREFSCNVQEDLIELYKRAYFSASVNHTNNGLDNIEMMDVGNNEWRLAPSFNNLPSPYSDAEFKVAFDDSLIARNLFDLNEQFQMRLATSVGIDKQVAMALAKQVDDAISSAPELATKHGLSQNDRAFLTGAMPQLSTTSFSASESINKGPRI